MPCGGLGLREHQSTRGLVVLNEKPRSPTPEARDQEKGTDPKTGLLNVKTSFGLSVALGCSFSFLPGPGPGLCSCVVCGASLGALALFLVLCALWATTREPIPFLTFQRDALLIRYLSTPVYVCVCIRVSSSTWLAQRTRPPTPSLHELFMVKWEDGLNTMSSGTAPPIHSEEEAMFRGSFNSGYCSCPFCVRQNTPVCIVQGSARSVEFEKCPQSQLKWLTRRPVLKGHLLQCPPLVVAWERPASAANQREHLDLLESTKVSAVSPDVF